MPPLLAAAPDTVPHRPLQQKEQKNFRLTQVCIRMLQRLGVAMGHSESGVIETLVREEFARRGMKLESNS